MNRAHIDTSRDGPTRGNERDGAQGERHDPSKLLAQDVADPPFRETPSASTMSPFICSPDVDLSKRLVTFVTIPCAR